MRYFALRSNFITPLPLLLLPPARLTIASHNIFLRTLKRGWAMQAKQAWQGDALGNAAWQALQA